MPAKYDGVDAALERDAHPIDVALQIRVELEARSRELPGRDIGRGADPGRRYERVASRDGPSPSLDRLWNKGFEDFANIGHHTLNTAFRSLMWKGMADPRVPVEDAGRFGFDGVTSLWFTAKYPARASDIPLATWEEAQLIIAEASAQAAP